MAGLFIIHPRSAYTPVVDHDFALMIQEWAILPHSTVPNTMSMEFNFFTINGRSAPYITPLVVRLGSRVRIRFVNMSAIDHHPMHMHGHTFWITGTEAGRIPESAWIPSNNVLVGVAQAREVEFIANNPGDWMIHCHMFHHMMNHMASMVGPMEMTMNNKGNGRSGNGSQGHQMHGASLRRMPAGTDMAPSLGMIERGPALAREHGASLGRGMGEQTGADRAVRNGPSPQGHGGHGGLANMQGHAGGQHGGHSAANSQLVPGFPQDMMDMMGMYSADELRRIQKPLTRGMRRDWFTGVEGLMTVIRVLPPDLYDRVVSGEDEIPPGASVPGATPGRMLGQEHGKH